MSNLGKHIDIAIAKLKLLKSLESMGHTEENRELFERLLDTFKNIIWEGTNEPSSTPKILIDPEFDPKNAKYEIETIMRGEIYCQWYEPNIGFGEMHIHKNPFTNQFIADAECMGIESTRMILYAAVDAMLKDAIFDTSGDYKKMMEDYHYNLDLEYTKELKKSEEGKHWTWDSQDRSIFNKIAQKKGRKILWDLWDKLKDE